MPTYDVEGVKQSLLERVASSDAPREILKATQIREMYGAIASLPPEERGAFGKQVNEVKLALKRRLKPVKTNSSLLM